MESRYVITGLSLYLQLTLKPILMYSRLSLNMRLLCCTVITVYVKQPTGKTLSFKVRCRAIYRRNDLAT